MRKLLITRGFQGVGKSTLLRKFELQDYVLCADDLRNLFASPELQLNGQWSINHQNENLVWQFLFERLEARMKNGDFVVVDAMHLLSKSIQPYLKLAQDYHYDVACIDFQKYPLEQALINNRNRAPHRQIPDDVIINCQQKLLNQPKTPNGIYQILWEQDASHEDKLKSWLGMQITDLSHYRKIHHIGDLQGCFEVLKTYLQGEPKKDEFYIFIGDYFDRGLENAELANWLFEHYQDENLLFLWGNHEEILAKDLRSEEIDDPYYLQRTKVEFQNQKIELESFKPFLKNLKDLLIYQYQDKVVYCSHAGFDCIPKQPHLLSTIQLQSGIGVFQYDVDALFEADIHNQQKYQHYQVHGHRNANMYEIDQYPHSFNLEGMVEFGGDLRCVMLDSKGFHAQLIPNQKYCPIENRIPTFYSFIPHWIKKAKKEKDQSIKDHTQIRYDHALEIFQHYCTSQLAQAKIQIPTPTSFLIVQPNHLQKKLEIVEILANQSTKVIALAQQQSIFDAHHSHQGKQKYLYRQLTELKGSLLLTQSGDIVAMLGPSLTDHIFANDLKLFLKNHQWPIFKL